MQRPSTLDQLYSPPLRRRLCSNCQMTSAPGAAVLLNNVSEGRTRGVIWLPGR